jgi:hypothetical protein
VRHPIPVSRSGVGRKHARLIILEAATVKPFKQRELHRTVTIRPELGIANQKVTQK